MFLITGIEENLAQSVCKLWDLILSACYRNLLWKFSVCFLLQSFPSISATKMIPRFWNMVTLKTEADSGNRRNATKLWSSEKCVPSQTFHTGHRSPPIKNTVQNPLSAEAGVCWHRKNTNKSLSFKLMDSEKGRDEKKMGPWTRNSWTLWLFHGHNPSQPPHGSHLFTQALMEWKWCFTQPILLPQQTEWAIW